MLSAGLPESLEVDSEASPSGNWGTIYGTNLYTRSAPGPQVYNPKTWCRYRDGESTLRLYYGTRRSHERRPVHAQIQRERYHLPAASDPSMLFRGGPLLAAQLLNYTAPRQEENRCSLKPPHAFSMSTTLWLTLDDLTLGHCCKSG